MKQFIISMLVFIAWALVLFSFVIKAQNGQEPPFYYYQGEKIFLPVDYARISMVSEREYNHEDTISLLFALFTVESSRKLNAKAGVVSDGYYASAPSMFLLRKSKPKQA